MNVHNASNFVFVLIIFTLILSKSIKTFDFTDIESENNRALMEMYRYMIDSLQFGEIGDNGRVGIVGGSEEFSGAPYFSAISSLKTGAELVYVVTTREAAPVIQAYTPDLLVYPFLNRRNLPEITKLLNLTDVLVIGPGLGNNIESLEVVSQIIEKCKQNKIPLILDDEAVYVVIRNLTLLQNYPKPGIILTPNYEEFNILEKSLIDKNINMTNLGKFISILGKGKEDQFYSNSTHLQWVLSTGGTKRRVGGQGHILSGILSIFFHWSIKYNVCKDYNKYQVGAAFASLAAAKLVRCTNKQAVHKFGRSMVATDMIPHISYCRKGILPENILFEKNYSQLIHEMCNT